MMEGWPRWAVVLVVGLGLLLYLRSPIDLLPDRMGPLGILDDFVMIGAALWWLRHRPDANGAPTKPPPTRDEQPTDPYAILDVAPGASPDEITRAYREQLKRYHPDRVAGLGEELQRVAHERTIAIQRAYETLRVR